MDSLIHAVPDVGSHACGVSGAPPFAQRGFTLTEMAVVLVIVALLIGGMILPMSAQQDLRARQETEKAFAEVREALIGFAVINGRLPRPAISAANGAERGGCSNDADCSGFIPWATLGVQRSDSWGKLIRYSVTPIYANNAITITAIANRTVQTRDTAGNLLYLAGQASCSATNLCPPAIIFSHGKDRWGATDAGMALPDGSATNADEDSNNTGPLNYLSRVPTTNTATSGGEFDDIVVWLPQSILMHRMIAAGRLP